MYLFLIDDHFEHKTAKGVNKSVAAKISHNKSKIVC